MIRRFFMFFTRPWVLALIGIIALSLLIWFVGPLIAIAEYKPMDKDWVRVLIIFVLLTLWGLNNLRTHAADRKADKRFSEALAKDTESKTTRKSGVDKESSAEEAILSKRLKGVLKTLQSQSLYKGRKLYKLPWYVIIGVPGSGKTTALKNSGLHFPLQSKLGKEPVKGAGGTRYCDWWFTNEAILIDTAGRYTSQDNPKKSDGHTWLGFLNLLKKARPKRPLNGVIVTVSILDILKKTPTQQALQASTIKRRIQELNDHLGMTLPVYVVFSKIDLIAGFNNFFSDMEQEDREQIWGMTFNPNKVDKATGMLSQFKDEYMALLNRANDRVLTLLYHERDPQRRTMIYEFPNQMRGLSKKLHGFLSEIFTPNQYEQSSLLRGIYFVSSTQSAMPANWVSGVLPHQYCAAPLVSKSSTEPKSFFIKRLFKDMIFSEANIATANTRTERRFRWTYRIITALATVTFSAGAFAWYMSYEKNTAYISHVYSSIEEYKKTTNGGLTSKQEWKLLAHGLNRLRDLPTGYVQGPEEYPVDMGFGLYQGYKVGAQTRTTYLKSLQLYFMPALSKMLLKQIDLAGTSDDYLYEALRFYLMLYNRDKMDNETFIIWVTTLWNKYLPGDDNQLLRKMLNEHLSIALLEQIPPARIDRKRVEHAREILIKTPLDVRLYRRLKSDYMQEHTGRFRLGNVLGKKADLLFFRKSGRPLSEGIPELFTYKGFHTGFNLENKQLAQRLADERWIYGDSADKKFTKADIKAISKRVEEYYFTEYVSRWKSMLNDLQLRSFTTANQGRMVLRILASADKPIITFLKEVRKNTALSELPGSADTAKQVAGGIVQSSSKLSQEQRRLQRILPKSSKSSSMQLPGQTVSNEFADLNDYINLSKGLPLAQLQQSFVELNKYFRNLAFANDFKQAAFKASRSSDAGGGSIKPVLLAVSEAPDSVQGWFRSLARDSRRVTAVATQGYINNAWRSEVVSFYEKAIKGRYPIDATSSKQVKLDDFITFFGPQGILDTYFDKYLKAYIDTTGDSWKRRRKGVSEKTMRLFERAKRIQLAYFPGQDKQPQVKFVLQPYALDNIVKQSILATNGTEVIYKHGPIRRFIVEWPGKESSSTDLVFTLASNGTPISKRLDGDWSWFRMMDKHATVEKIAGQDNLLLTFNMRGVQAQYELQPQSTQNPFSNTEIRNFVIPKRL